MSLLVVGTAVTAGCTSATHQRRVVVHVRAMPRGASPHPMSGALVTAADAHWNLWTATLDRMGNATLRLAPGHYVLNSSQGGCRSEPIKLQAGETKRTVALPCDVR